LGVELAIPDEQLAEAVAADGVVRVAQPAVHGARVVELRGVVEIEPRPPARLHVAGRARLHAQRRDAREQRLPRAGVLGAQRDRLARPQVAVVAALAVARERALLGAVVLGEPAEVVARVRIAAVARRAQQLLGLRPQLRQLVPACAP
jgi:hypothetical protein